MKRKLVQIIIFSVAITIIVFYYLFLNFSWRKEEWINRAQVARMLVALKYDLNTCESILDEITLENIPEDVDMNSWYAKYALIALDEEWLCMRANNMFEPGEHLNYGDLKNLMEVFGLTEDMISFSIKHRQPDAFVTKTHWCEIYKLLAVHQKNILQTERIFYTSPTTKSDLESWEVDTEDGIKKAEGISVDDYLNQKVEIFEANGHVLCIIRCVEDLEETKLDFQLDTENVEEKKTIRVILQSDSLDYEHKEVCLTSDDDFCVQQGESTREYTKGETAKFWPENFDDEFSTIKIATKNPEGTLRLKSLKRDYDMPEYKGILWIYRGTKGLWIINEVELEDYVAAVVSSEMPSSYGMEALKSQAVCARTYALKKMESKFKDFPADVDDTTVCQVYNNKMCNLQSIQAAKETEGEILWDSNGLASIWFFSTSCGSISSSQEVWYDGNSKKSDIAKTVFLSKDKSYLNLTDELSFRSFIDQETDIHYYEEELPWFRWNTFIDDDDIKNNVETYQGIAIGKIKEVSVIERGISGIAKALSVEGELDSTVIYGEYNIRKILSPENTYVIQQNGNEVTQMKLLPSGYFYIDPLMEENVGEGYLIYGGGYGHGCGMSQNGAMKMAESGKNYEEILSAFFPEAELRNEIEKQ